MRAIIKETKDGANLYITSEEYKKRLRDIEDAKRYCDRRSIPYTVEYLEFIESETN